MRYLQVLPLTLTLVLFLVFPILLIGVVSFWDYNEFELLPDFVWTNYEELFTSSVTYTIYFATLKFAFLTWVFTLLIGFTVAYFLAFHVHDLKWQIVLFLLCTIPFWTSNIIRMIAWIPVLGRHGLVNDGLLALGVVDEPLEWLLFSEFSVVLAFVHLYTLFMVVPIFNSMMRIDPSVIEAAYDAGAGTWRTIWHVILPLCKPGIAIGTIFVVTLVMGDFVTVQMMSGGQSASVGVAMNNKRALLQYPAAAADAVILLARGADDGGGADADRRRAQGARRDASAAPEGGKIESACVALFFALFVVFMYGPIIAVVILSFQGVDGGLTFPMNGVSVHWFGKLFEKQMVGDFEASFARSFSLALAGDGADRGVLAGRRPRVPQAVPAARRWCSTSRWRA